MNVLRKILRFLLPIVVVAVGALVFVALLKTRPEAPRAPSEPPRTPVTVTVVTRAAHPLVVRGQGSVAPSRDLVLQPELSGRVVWRHPELLPGGLVRAGDTLVRMDPRDFRAAVAQQSAVLESQRVQVQTEDRRRAIAEREWELLSRQAQSLSASPEGRSLALREPQMRSAEASVDATEAQLRQARLTLTRTTLRAPFDAVVREADVEVGQLVGPTARLATLVATDSFWVQVSLPIENLAGIRVPPPGAGREGGSEVRVHQQAGGVRIERRGRVIRLLGDLDPVGRMARVLVEIDDPLGLRETEPSVGAPSVGGEGAAPARVPLLLGAYVHVEIDAGVAEGAIEIPRVALRDEDTAWVVVDDALAIRPVRVLWRSEETVLIGEGLSEGDRVVVSPLAAPVEGMALRILEAAADDADDADHAPPSAAAPTAGEAP